MCRYVVQWLCIQLLDRLLCAKCDQTVLFDVCESVYTSHLFDFEFDFMQTKSLPCQLVPAGGNGAGTPGPGP